MAARRVGSLIRQSEGVKHTAARAHYILLAVIGLRINWVDERIGPLSSIQIQLNCISGHWPIPVRICRHRVHWRIMCLLTSVENRGNLRNFQEV